jgi:hypothetical protein
MPPCSDLLATAILGPWVAPAVGGARRRQVFLSLVHWYEAAKFKPHRPLLCDALLLSPSIKEARKFARAREGTWRSDWPVTRHSVLAAGLGMLALQRPEMELRSCPLDGVRAGLDPMQLPAVVRDSCVERFAQWRAAPRICVFGADLAPSQLVGARLARLVAPLPNWTLVMTCGPRTAWRVHDWALQQYVPVEYHGTPSQRPGRRLTGAVIAASDHVVVFEERAQKRFDGVLQLAKHLKRKISLELYDVGAEAARQLTLA